jgi:hypothetical protein
MVNFRFHLVSLIAVFLALGLGILTGSAVVNQATVKAIRREISDVRSEVNNLRSQNSDLRNTVDRSNSFMSDAAAYTVDSRLVDVPVVVLAERGVAKDAVNDTIALVRTAGADAPALVWLEDKWKLADPDDVQALRDATDLLGGANSVRSRALEQLTRRLAEPPNPTTVAPGTPDLLQRLSDAGFISIEGDNVDLATFPTGPSRALVVTGTDSTFSGTRFTSDLARAAVAAPLPTVVGEVFVQKNGDNAPARGDSVAAIRTSKDLSASVTTIDDLDLVQGRVAGVIALQDLGVGVFGHYGYGSGATSSLPPPPQQ